MQGVFGRLAQLALFEQEGRWREEPHNPKLGPACKHRWVAFFTPYELAKVYCEKNEGKGDVDMETAKLIWNAMRKYEGFIPLYTPKRKIAPSFSHGAACYGFYHDLFRPDDKEASHNIRLKAGMLPPPKKQRADEVRDDDMPPVIRLCSEAGEKWKQEAMQAYGWTTAEADNALDRLFAGSDETREIICSSAYYYDTLSASTMQPVPVKGSIMFFINKNSTTHFCVQYSPESTGGLVERYVNIKLNPQAEFIVEIHETTPLSTMVTRKAALTSSSATTTTISRMTWAEFAEMCTGLKEPETAVADDLELELVKFQAAVAQLKPSSIPKLGRGARTHRVAVKGKS